MTVPALVMRTPVHATVILHPPASAQITAVVSLFMHHLVRSMTVCFIMTHTSALVLSTACTATQKCIISTSRAMKKKTKTNTIAGIVSVTAVVIRTPVCATITLYLPAFVRNMAISSPSLQQLIHWEYLSVCFIMIHTSALVLSIACTATQECMISTTRDIRTKTSTSVWIITVTALVIWTTVHALVALYLVSASITSQPQPQSVQLLQVSMFLDWNSAYCYTFTITFKGFVVCVCVCVCLCFCDKWGH